MKHYFEILFFASWVRIQMNLDSKLEQDPHYNVCGSEKLREFRKAAQISYFTSYRFNN